MPEKRFNCDDTGCLGMMWESLLKVLLPAMLPGHLACNKKDQRCVIHDVQAFYSAVEPSQDGEAQIQPKPPISCAKGLFAKYSQYAI